MQQFTPKQYLQIAIANHYGLDKKTWNERLEWTQDHNNDLESFDTDAKEAIGFRKAVRAWRAVEKGEPTNYAMGLDATASGIQMLATLAGCVQSASTCNLVNTGRRENPYGHIHHSMQRGGSKAGYEQTKDAVMQSCYDGKAKVKQVYGDGTPEQKLFYDTLMDLIPGAWRAKQLMSRCQDPDAIAYRWTLPDHHVAYVPVVYTEETNFELDELSHLRMKYRYKVQGPKDKDFSLPANITHSVDGWVCRQMVLRCHQAGFWMAPVHDCFYASPKYMNQVRMFYNQILAELAQMDLLQSIVREITGRKINVLKASKDLHKLILDADYAIC